jgi:hypothetical protein
MNNRVKLFLGMVILLSGCAGNEKYDSAKSAEYKKFMVPTNTARIYFKTGNFLPNSDKEMEHFMVSIFKINNQDIGTTYLGQVMVVDVKPGTYLLSWSAKGSSDGYVIQQKEINLRSSEYIIASSDLKQSGADQGAAAGGILFGLLGGLAGAAMGKTSGPTGEYSIGLTGQKSKITESRFVKPIACPSDFCITD